jgi:hypothetical protein
METFEQWIKRTGQYTTSISAMDLGKRAWNASTAQSRNYVTDEEKMPKRITFDNGRVVTIVDNEDGFYLEVGQRDSSIDIIRYYEHAKTCEICSLRKNIHDATPGLCKRWRELQ